MVVIHVYYRVWLIVDEVYACAPMMLSIQIEINDGGGKIGKSNSKS